MFSTIGYKKGEPKLIRSCRLCSIADEREEMMEERNTMTKYLETKRRIEE